MAKQMSVWAVGLYALLFASGPGGNAIAGPCDIVDARTDFDLVAPEGGGAYDVFQTGRTEVRFQVTLENTTDTRQACRLVFETTSTDNVLVRDGGSDQLDFDVRRGNGSGRLISDAGDGTRRPRLNFNVDAASERTRDFLFSIPGRQFVLPGSYAGELNLATFLQGNAGATLDERPIRFATEVDPQGALFVSVTGRPRANAEFKTAFLDFGAITKDNNSAQIRFLIQSNGRFQFQVSSENGGRLELQDGGGNINGFEDFIAYTVNGEAVSDAPADFSEVFDPTRRRGDRQNFTVELQTGPNNRPTLDVPEGKLAGRYEDTLTFSIVPRE